MVPVGYRYTFSPLFQYYGLFSFGWNCRCLFFWSLSFPLDHISKFVFCSVGRSNKNILFCDCWYFNCLWRSGLLSFSLRQKGTNWKKKKILKGIRWKEWGCWWRCWRWRWEWDENMIFEIEKSRETFKEHSIWFLPRNQSRGQKYFFVYVNVNWCDVMWCVCDVWLLEEERVN